MDFTDYVLGDIASRCDEWEQLATIVIDGVEYVPAHEALVISTEAALAFYDRLLSICCHVSVIFILALFLGCMSVELFTALRKKKQLKQNCDPQP